jgi:putative MATE family efflux protein
VHELAQNLEKKRDMILNQTPIWKGMLMLAIPVFLVNILKTLHDVVDGFFLGQIQGIDNLGVAFATYAQSAVGITWSVYFIFISFGIGLSVAGNALIGQYVGKKDPVGSKRYASNVVVMSFLLGIIFNIILFLLTPLLMKLMGAEGLTLQYSITYLRTRSFEMPFLFLSFGFQAVRQSTGDTTTPVIVSAVSIIVNIALTWWMVSILHMGVYGAALSTVIGNISMVPIIIYLFIYPKNGIKVSIKKDMIDFSIIKHVLKVAIPASTGQAIQAFGFVIINTFILAYGPAVSAAYYIGNRINSLIMFPVSAVSSILAIYIAQNVGANNIPRAKAAFRTCMTIAVSLMTVGALLIIPFRMTLVSIFNNTDLETIKYAAEYTLFLHLGLPLMGIFQTYLSAFQGSGDTKYSFLMALIRLWVLRIPMVLAFKYLTNLGPLGVWYAMLISNILIVFVGYYLYTKVRFLPKIKSVSA